MTPTAQLVVALLGLVAATFSATTAQVLHEFARHELEEYCRLRGRLAWFDQIVEMRKQLIVTAETVQMLGVAVYIIFGLIWFLGAIPIESIGWIGACGLAGLAALVLLITNCWIPWAVLHIGGSRLLYSTWRFWHYVARAARPLSAGVGLVSAVLHRLSGTSMPQQDEEEAFEEEIRSMVSEGQRDGLLEPDAREMIEGVIELDDQDVGKVMTPRSRVDALRADTSWQELLDYVIAVGRSRIPVYEDQLNQVIGILYVKDLLAESIRPPQQRAALRNLLRPTLFVPESTLLDEMLQQFLQNRIHMAMVVDEYGSLAGVVTIEDVLEEIVGEIEDETDSQRVSEIRRIDDSRVEVDAGIQLEQLNEELGLGLPEDQDFDTLAGLLMRHFCEIPKPGRSIVIGGAKFDVTQASGRSIQRVRIGLPPAATVHRQATG